jgi:hypothetical protein
MDSIIAEYKELLLDLLSKQKIPFDDKLHGSLPKTRGVYRILENDGIWQNSLYVGVTTNLQSRIYTNRLMGNRKASRLKKKLIKSGDYPDEDAVKEYLQNKCLVQYIEIEKDNLRDLFEHFAISILKPKHYDKKK